MKKHLIHHYQVFFFNTFKNKGIFFSEITKFFNLPTLPGSDNIIAPGFYGPQSSYQPAFLGSLLWHLSTPEEESQFCIFRLVITNDIGFLAWSWLKLSSFGKNKGKVKRFSKMVYIIFNHWHHFFKGLQTQLIYVNTFYQSCYTCVLTIYQLLSI